MTQEELKQLLDYNEETGIFTWLVKPSLPVNAGDKAGSLHVSGYRQLKIHKKLYKEHRLAWLYVYGAFPTGELDHKNGICDDNRIVNLRLATRSQNGANSKERKNLWGKRGVHRQSSGRFQSKITFNGKSLHFGTYDTVEEAATISAAARHRLHGEFARGCG